MSAYKGDTSSHCPVHLWAFCDKPNVDLGEGWVVSFLETSIDPLTLSDIFLVVAVEEPPWLKVEITTDNDSDSRASICQLWGYSAM